MEEETTQASSDQYASENQHEVIDTSWIKEEPIDEELYINTHVDDREEEEPEEDFSEAPGEQDGNNESEETALERLKRNLEFDDNDALSDNLQPAAKLRKVKIEPVDDFEQSDLLVDPLALASDVKEEEAEEEYATEEEEDDEEYEEGYEGAAQTADIAQEPQIRSPSLKIKRCAKCAIVFSQIPKNVPAVQPSALQKFCPKCKPNVSITCKFCGKHFEHHKLYSRHVRACGSGVCESIKCVHCNDCFLTVQQLKAHKCKWADSVRLLRFVCPICCEGFEKNKERVAHKNLHVVPRIVHCHTCNVTCNDVRSYQEHMDLHLVRRHFICTVCYMSFESRSLFDLDQKRHRKMNELTDEITHVPDFVYVCRSCKHWYPTLYAFGHHDCKNVSITDPTSLTNVVLRALDFGGENNRTPTVPGFQVSGSLMSSETMISPPPRQETKNTDSEESGVSLGSSFKCQLCKDIFETASALGYHSCLSTNSAYDIQDSDSEDESILSEGAPETEESSIHVKLITPSRVLGYQDIRRRGEPNASSEPDERWTKLRDSRTVLQVDMCIMCGSFVGHNFNSNIMKKSTGYLCTFCLHSNIRKGLFKYKCYKCPQVFPTLARLHMHMPWHRDEETKKEEGSDKEDFEFKRPRVAFPGERSFELMDESSSDDMTMKPSPKSGAPEEEEPSPTGQKQTEVSTQKENATLSELLKEPVSPLPGTKKLLFQGPRSKVGTNIVSLSVPKPASKIQTAPLLPATPFQPGQAISGKGPSHVVLNPPVTTHLGGQALAGVSQGVLSQLSLGSGGAPMLINMQNPSDKPKIVQLASVQNQRPGMFVHVTPNGLGGKVIQMVGNPVQQNLQNVTLVPVQPPSQSLNVLPPGLIQVLPQSMTSTLQRPGNAPVLVPLNIATNQKPLHNLHVNATSTSSVSGANSPLLDRNSLASTAQQKEGTPATKGPNPMKISAVTQTGSSTAEVTLTANDFLRAHSRASMSVEKTVNTSIQLQKVAGGSQDPRGYFLCYSCRQLFDDAYKLRNHGCNIVGSSCNSCKSVFDTAEELYSHKCKPNSYKCHMCQKNCSSPEELNQHPCIDSNDIRIGSVTGGQDNLAADDSREGPQMMDKPPGEHNPSSMDPENLVGRTVKEAIRLKLAKKGINVASSGPKTSKDKTKDLTCFVCSKVFSSTTALYVHKMRHNIKC